jgi:peptidyl-prolyl cis-trans isomerase C
VTGCSKNNDKVIAEVNEEKIYQMEVDELMEKIKINAEKSGVDLESDESKEMLAQYKTQIIDGLIQKKLIEQISEDENINVTEEELDEVFNYELENAKKQMGEEEFKKFMEENQLTEKELKEQMYFQMLQQKLYEKVISDVKVTAAEIENYYNEKKEILESVMVRHILFMAEKDKATEDEKKDAYNNAVRVIAKLDNGADFVELVKEYSEEPGAEQSGGLIPQFFTKDTLYLVKPFVEGSFKLEEGEYSREPVETSFGYHIIKVEEKKDTFEELKDEIEVSLLKEKQSKKYSEYYQSKKDSADIKRY